MQQIDEMFTDKISGLEDNYRLLEDVIDLRDSAAWKEGTAGELRTDDTRVVLEAGKEPAVQGSLKTASELSDALMLSAPLVARNAANPLLKEIQSEMTNKERKFTFLCGHDLNLGCLLDSLEVEPYELPLAIEKRTPIGSKLVFSRWRSEGGEAFWDVDLVYQTPAQLRNADILTWDHSPSIYDLSFRETEQNADGLYPEKVLLDRFKSAVNAYDSMAETYR